MDSFGYIYKTTNKINGKIYIGQRGGSFSPSYFGSGVAITKAVHKYGKENFKIEMIAFASDRNELNLLEMKYIREYRESVGRDMMYNITDGGEGCSGWHPSEETKEKIRVASNKQFSDPEMRRMFSEMAKVRFSDKRKHPCYGRQMSEDTKKKISDANKKPKIKLLGIPKSQKHREMLRLAWEERKKRGTSEMTRLRMINAHIGMKDSDEVRKNKSLAAKKVWESRKASLMNKEHHANIA